MLDRRQMIGSLVLGTAALSTKSYAATPGSGFAQEMNAFGPEAARLAQRTGLWDCVETVWAGPSAIPSISHGLIAERRMYGSLLQEILRPADDRQDRAVARTDMLAYNRIEGHWGYVSFDTRAPVGLMQASGNADISAATISVSFAPFAVPGPGPERSGQLMHMDQIFRFVDAGHDFKDQYFSLADGTGMRWLTHRYAYTRNT